MSLTQKRKTTITGTGAGDIVVHDETQIKIETVITEVCDNPKCRGRHGNDGPTTRTWVMEKSQENVMEIPEDMWQFIHRGRFAEAGLKTYCSSQCEKEAVRDE